MALRRWRISGPPMSPAWMMCADPASAARASGRSRPWVSEIRPIGLADVFEADILNGVALPIAVIEVPPLGLEDGESLFLHGGAQQVAAGALLGGAAGVVRVGALRHLVVDAGHLHFAA